MKEVIYKTDNIINYNSEGEYHGYQERYWCDKLYYRANWRYDCCIGYEEYHSEYHLYETTRFHIR